MKIFTDYETVVYCIISVIIITLSGTRGYMIMLALPLFVIILMYVLDVPNGGKKIYLRTGSAMLIFALLIIAIMVKSEYFAVFLRLDQSLGYRENENIFVIELMKRAPWVNKLFGFGFGGNAMHVDGVFEAAQIASWNRNYMYGKLLKRSIFHNYWYTVLFKQGALGLVYIVVAYIVIFERVFKSVSNHWTKMLLLMLLIGSMISITFRITATCSMLEMLLAVRVIKVLGKKSIQEGSE